MQRTVASAFPLLAAVCAAALAACGDASGQGGLQDTVAPGGAGGAGSDDGGSARTSGGGGSSSSGGSGGANGGDAGAASGPVDATAPIVTDPFASLKSGAEQMSAFCGRGSTDAASVALCKSPTITGLTDLQSALGLGFAHPDGTNGFNGNPAFVLLGHSASLGLTSITAANPRVVMMTAPSAWLPQTNPAMNADGMGPPPGWEPPTGWTQPASWTPPTITGTMASWPPWDWGCTPVVAAASRSLLGDSPIHTFYGDDDDDDDGPSCFPTTVSNPTPPSAVALGFTRGTGIVEVASAEPTTGALHFIAVHYTSANTAPAAADAGTATATNYGASSETNWTSWTAYDDSDLADTTMDCTHCHQPGGPSTSKQLRMNESGTPWTHTMSSWTAGGQALLADFHGVHGTTETYGGIPAAMIDKSEPMTLQLASGCDGCTKQPVTFDSASIEQEVASSAPGQPASNATPGTSATWTKLYTAGLASHTIVPYHDVKVTDPTKLAAAAATYQATGNADMSDLFTADAKTATLVTPALSMDGPTLLQAACADCHNGNVPATLVRGQFDATNLAAMSRAVKDTAIGRLQLTSADIHHMPPESMHQLTANQIQILKAVLEQ